MSLAVSSGITESLWRYDFCDFGQWESKLCVALQRGLVVLAVLWEWLYCFIRDESDGHGGRAIAGAAGQAQPFSHLAPGYLQEAVIRGSLAGIKPVTGL